MLILKKYHPLLIVFLIVFFCSCTSPRFYTPNINPVPLFREKGDFHLNGSTNFFNKGSATIGGSVFNGFGMYAGVAGAYEGYKVKDYNSNPPYNLIYTYHRYKGSMANFGAGYYLSNKISENFRFEIYGDLALGNYKNTILRNNIYNSLDGEIKGKYKRVGILTNIGYYSLSDDLSIAYTCRLSHINFSDPSILGIYQWSNEMARLNNKSGYGYDLMEHGINICKGFSDIKLQTQISLFHGLNSKGDEYDAVQFSNYSINIGIALNLNFFDFK